MGKTYVVTGGAPLRGEVTVGGSKNTITKMMVASLLSQEPITLTNVPRVGEVDLTIELLSAVGTQITWDKTNGSALSLISPQLQKDNVLASFSGRNRIPILLVGPLLHRNGIAEIPIAGGDKIGPRPIDFHIAGYRAMGAEVEEKGSTTVFRAERLRGASITLPYPSVMTTENLLLAAVLAEGKTVIKNAAVEPEIIDLIDLLQKMGAIIFHEPERTFVIEGVKSLGGAKHCLSPDRIEAASFASAAVATKGSVLVRGINQQDMRTFLNVLRKVGGAFEVQKDGILFYYNGSLHGTTIETGTHPGFMTDWQPPFSLVLTQAEGTSVIHETVHEKRFGYFEGLNKMGADVHLFNDCLGGRECRFREMTFGHSAVIAGPTLFKAANLEIPDLRAGFVYVIAALMANGTSVISGIEHLDRGYELLVEKLSALGAQIRVETSSPHT
jgi:UDP-N-acetylglucosamine 1-carboxyvinyltransferase